MRQIDVAVVAEDAADDILCRLDQTLAGGGESAFRGVVHQAGNLPVAIGVFLGHPRLERTAVLERGPAVKRGLRADEQAETVQRYGYARRLIGGEAWREQSRRRRVQHR